jgi:hypothetical protein
MPGAGGAPKHVFDTACRRNADGEALESWLLAQAPPNSALAPFFADDSVPCR